MSFTSELRNYFIAGFPAIWVTTSEQQEAFFDILRLCADDKWTCVGWDCDIGFYGEAALKLSEQQKTGARRPAAVFSLCQHIAETAVGKTVFVLKNFHRRDMTENSEVLQALLNFCALARTRGWHVIVLSPISKQPVEWEAEFVSLDYGLPDAKQLYEIAEGVADATELPETAEELQEVMAAAGGMTRSAAENAFALSIVKHRKLCPELLWQLKAKTLKNTGYLTLYEGKAAFAQLGGLDVYKDFSLKLLRSKHPIAKPRGQLLLGVPGSGKSQAVKSLGAASGRPVLMLDMGAIRSKYQGETDQNMRNAIKIAEAMQPCILAIDEVEKALAGSQSSGELDSGVTSRVLGTLLTWLNDHDSEVFVACTCNDISGLPAEFTRAERFDSIFFFDLPSDIERQAIWEIYFDTYCLPKNGVLLSSCTAMSENWTGAEIKTACRLAAMMECSVGDAMSLVTPIHVRLHSEIEKLREWARTNCLSASTVVPARGTDMSYLDAILRKQRRQISANN